MSPSAQLASFLSQRFVKSEPVNLVDLCTALGLRIQEVDARGFDGALVRSKAGQKGIVAVKASIREYSRKRFTIAHEIGHFVMPHHRFLKNVCNEKKIDSFYSGLGRAELEANEFAAELLLPTAIAAKRFNLKEFSLTNISRVATDFEISLTAAVRSFLQLTSLPCAMVWSVNNRARWCARSEAFRFFLPIAELPAQGSFACNLFNGQDAPSDFERVPAAVWLTRDVADEVAMLLEHSVHFAHYNAVLSLLWATGVAAPVEEAPLLDELEPENFSLSRQRWPR